MRSGCACTGPGGACGGRTAIMDERPLDLRSLAEVDDAEVVRLAVRRFRRRVLVRSAWILLAALGIAALAVHSVREHDNDFRARIFEGPSWNGAVAVYRVAGTTVQVQKVTVIPGRRLGLVMVYGPASADGQDLIVVPP